MSFNLLRKLTRGEANGGVKMTSFFSKADTPLVTFTFGVAVQREMGLAVGDRILLYLGEGNDKGLLRLVKTEDENHHASRVVSGGNKGSTLVRFQRALDKGVVSTRNPATNCVWRLGAEVGVLEIELPEWAGGPPLYRDQKIAQLQPRQRADASGRPVKAISE